MKFNFKFFNYLKHLFYSENPDNKSEVEKRKVGIENNLRWQDDGGPAVDTRPLNPVDAAAPKPGNPPGKDSL